MATKSFLSFRVIARFAFTMALVVTMCALFTLYPGITHWVANAVNVVARFLATSNQWVLLTVAAVIAYITRK